MKKSVKILMASLVAVLSLCLFGGNKQTNLVHAEGDVIYINETNFPDEVFREYVKNELGRSNPDYFTTDECNAITRIGLDGGYNGSTISNLKGIEFFRELTYLSCTDNKLTGLDVSANIKLYSLDCSRNLLSELKLPNAEYNLTNLYCDENNLTSLDASKHTALQDLLCNNNQLSELKLPNDPRDLHVIVCDNNKLTSLDVSKCGNLSYLNCIKNLITDLRLPDNHDTLTNLYYGSNPMSWKDISAYTNLRYLDCSGLSLRTLDLSSHPDIEGIFCYDNPLTSLDLSAYTKLEDLDCSNTQLTSLDLSKNPLLEELNCSNNQLTSLDLSKNPSLEELKCSNNQLTSLDLSGNTSLEWLECNDNKIGSIKLNPSNLDTLFINNNRLTHFPAGDYSEMTNWVEKWFKADGQTTIAELMIKDGSFMVDMKSLMGEDGSLDKVTLISTDWEFDASSGIATFKGTGTLTPLKYKYTFSSDPVLSLEVTAAFETKYTPASGESESTYVKGSGQPLTLTFNRDTYDSETYKLFTGARVDGNPLSDHDYTIAPGSLKITLLSDYLDSLDEGEHTLTVSFADGGESSAAFTVAKALSPNTGDTFSMSILMMMLITSGLALTFVKKRYNR